MRIKEIDGLRGVAVLVVVAHHYLSWLKYSGAGYGWLGVDLFFVMSGFLISSILLDLKGKPHYFRTFYARRAFRIFPPYYFVLAIYLCASFLLHRPATVEFWSQYLFYYKSLFPGQPQDLKTAIDPTIGLGLAVLWSLSVEEIFYTIWAPIIRFTRERSLWLILTFIIVLAPVLRGYLHTAEYPELFTYYCRMDGLALGSVVALLLRRRNLSQRSWMQSDKLFDYALYAVSAVTILYWAATQGNRALPAVSTVGVSMADISFALALYAIVRHAGKSSFLMSSLRNRYLRSIGKVSYSLYLIHYPIRGISDAIVGMTHLHGSIAALADVALGAALSLIGAYAMWFGFEKRLLALKDRLVPTKSHVPVTAEKLELHRAA